MKVKIILVLAAAWFLPGLFGVGFGAASPQLTRSNSGGGVTAKATYLNPGATDDFRFQVVLDTHSVNLDDYDLKKLSFLQDDKGGGYPPERVESKGSGHHREFTLVFPKISPEVKRFELVIRDIAGVKERSFQWEIYP